jgi:hypothetical protein
MTAAAGAGNGCSANPAALAAAFNSILQQVLSCARPLLPCAEKLLWKSASVSGFFLLRFAHLWR